jgi:hypothetical protein
MPTPPQVESLLALIETGSALILAETHEERRILALLEAVSRRTQREVWTWSVSRGLRVLHGLELELQALGDRHPDANTSRELPEALRQVDRLTKPALVVLLDVHPYLSNPVITRALKELALKSEKTGLQIVLVGHDFALPAELAPWTSRFEVEPMTVERVQVVFKEELTRQRARSGRDVVGSQQTLASLTRHMAGLPEASVRHLARLALGDGQITTSDLARVLAAKREALGAAELLVFEHHLPSLDDVAGMAALKRWLALRRRPFLDPQGAGLPPPRGVLLLGVQGAGKSLAAKAVAASWEVPLFRMDFGALFDKWQGESERKLREALRVADTMAPCVLWMDEVEKGLAGGAGDGDTGAGKRMLATLLTWMAERRSAVFLVATANDIQSLPPELMRKGRFDEIFFVDLPDALTREAIFAIHLKRHAIAHEPAALQTLGAASEGFSGAEIEAAVVAARYEGHADGKPADPALVLKELARTRPLSVTRAEEVAALRAWAAERTVGAG